MQESKGLWASRKPVLLAAATLVLGTGLSLLLYANARRSWSPEALLSGGLFLTAALTLCLGLCSRRTAHLNQLNGQLLAEAFQRQRTEQALRESEARARQLNELLRATNQISHLINQERDPQQLLQQTCQLLLQARGYLTVWIGKPDPGPNKRVVVLARAGSAADYLGSAPITWDEQPTGLGPIGTAIRQRRTIVIDDLATDPSFEPWRAAVLASGAASLAAVPIQLAERLFGVLTVKANQPAAFDAEALQLLSALAADLACALQSLEAETERALVEKVLRQSEARYRLLFESNPHPMWVFDLQTLAFLEVNEAAIHQYGYSREEFLGMTVKDIRPPEDVQPLLENLAGVPVGLRRPGIFRHRRKDGTLIWAEITCYTLELEDRRTQLVLANDITQRTLAEEQLRASQARLQLEFDHMPIACISWDREHRVTSWNPAATAMFGFSAEEVMGRQAHEFLIPPEVQPQVQELWQRLEGGAAQVRSVNPNLTKDGRRLLCEWTNAPLYAPGGAFTGSLSMVQDITEKKSLEKQLFHAQRVESLGTLAAGIAHDLNNILAPIMMSAQILALNDPDAEERHLLNTIQSSAQRGAEVVQQVLTFARGVEGQRVSLQPKHLLKEIQRIAQETFPKNLLFRAEAPKDLWTVLGDATQLHQVLLNLCVNARDAMPEGGTLHISARNMQIDQARAGLFAEGQPGPHVVIEVRDSGPGIPPALLEKIFEPFFTTKEPGKGTGLGLSTVLGIVRSHGGFVDVRSQPGYGSTFQVFLPAQPSAPPSAPALAPAPLPKGAGQSVLVVDDEPNVRAITERILSHQGYRVLLAANGKEALELLAGHNPQAVVTDVMMPVMDGLALTVALRQARPGLPIIACTGWGQEGVRAKLKALGVESLLQKPYPADALLQTLQQELAAAQ